jgi:hypothetical protein
MWQELMDEVARISALDDPWVDFSSGMTITASVTPPTLGSSTLAAYYKARGKTVHLAGRLDCVTGGAWNVGSGTYYFVLPVAAAAGSIALHTGSVFIEDASVGQRLGICRLQDSTHLILYYNNGAATATPLGSGGPGSAWATGDLSAFSITYEAA